MKEWWQITMEEREHETLLMSKLAWWYYSYEEIRRSLVSEIEVRGSIPGHMV